MLTPLSILLVLSAAFLHASWNALLRGGADRAQSMLIMNVTVGIAGLAMMALAGLPTSAAAYVCASGLIHLVYNALLVRMYRSGDLGETYPVARGSSPALVALGSSLIAGEWMNLIGTVGIGLVCAGIFMLAAARARPAKVDSVLASDRASNVGGGLHAMNLPFALATGVSIAAYTVVDGLGVRASGNWAAYTGGIFAFFLAVPLWYLARRRLRDVRRAFGGSGQGGQRRAYFACGLWRHHLGHARKRDGSGLGVARNQRGIRGAARSRLSQRAFDRIADRRLLCHRRRCCVFRLAALNLLAKPKAPLTMQGRFDLRSR